MLEVPLICLTLIGFSIFAADGAADCMIFPNFLKIKSCCKIPTPSIDTYSTQCGQYKLQPLPGQLNPCLVECVLNASGLITGGSVVNKNVKPVLSSLFPSNPEFIPPFTSAIPTCLSSVNTKISQMKASGQYLMDIKYGSIKCTPAGFLYSICATKNVFLNCPSSAWDASADCAAIKQYLGSCEIPGVW